MNKIVTIYIKGEGYNPMYKWNSLKEFKQALKSKEGVPKDDDTVVEAYINDDLIISNMIWQCAVELFELAIVY